MDHSLPIIANFAHTKWQNLPGGRGFNLFLISHEVIKNCGYFDENIFPAFWEDRDYQYRMNLWNGIKIKTYRNIRPWHGEHPDLNSNNSSNISIERDKKMMNYTSGTIYLGQEWLNTMNLASKWNLNYVTKKWGCDYLLSIQSHHLRNCTFTTPFNRTNALISEWFLDKERIYKIKLKYNRSVSLK